MKINRPAKAGSMESNDILVMVAPNEEGGIKLNFDSIVMQQFGEQIKNTILDKLSELQVNDITIKAVDKGALDYTIRARVETAVLRAGIQEVASNEEA